jgi:uncharacterized protein (DUF488 family)
MTLVTVGHGARAADDFTTLVTGAGVSLLVDVRIHPGSRRSPHFARSAIESWLPLPYRWEPRLGGRRKPPDSSIDLALREEAFRAYAAHLRTDEFRDALRDVVAEASASRVGVMCAESVWWRCHRKMIADAAMLLHSLPVLHLFHDGRLVRHEPAREARVTAAGLVYDVGADRPLR